MPFDEGGHAGLIKLNLITGFIIVNPEKSAMPLFIITTGRSKQTDDVVRLSKAFILKTAVGHGPAERITRFFVAALGEIERKAADRVRTLWVS